MFCLLQILGAGDRSALAAAVEAVPMSDMGNVMGLGPEAPGCGARGTFVAWHCAVAEAKPDSIARFLRGRVAEGALFHPPTYFAPWKGKDELVVLLTAAGEVTAC
jgi:hypothetical protein